MDAGPFYLPMYIGATKDEMLDIIGKIVKPGNQDNRKSGCRMDSTSSPHVSEDQEIRPAGPVKFSH